MDIVNVGYASTNYYVLGQPPARLLVDVGWPGTLPRLLANLQRKDIPFSEVRYLLATHYHPDHAGLAQELKDRGVRLIVLEEQLYALPLQKEYMKPADHYVEIRLDDNVVLTTAESRPLLSRIGIDGAIISTPGHSDDSVTLVLDTGAAFTGDLPRPAFAVEEAQESVRQSWEKVRALQGRIIYPGHGPVGRY